MSEHTLVTRRVDRGVGRLLACDLAPRSVCGSPHWPWSASEPEGDKLDSNGGPHGAGTWIGSSLLAAHGVEQWR
jgi:hypothetical protein